MKKIIFILILIIIQTLNLKSEDFRLNQLISGLNSPWSLTFKNENEILITEKSGQILFANLKNNTIRAGHYLVIPVATKPLSAYSKSADARLAKTQNRIRSGHKVEHIVKNGESFWIISKRYNVTIRQLSAWNAMAPQDTLVVGKKLIIWTSGIMSDREIFRHLVDFIVPDVGRWIILSVHYTSL